MAFAYGPQQRHLPTTSLLLGSKVLPVRDVFDAGELVPPVCLDQHVRTEPTQMRHGMAQRSPMEPVAAKSAFSGTFITASAFILVQLDKSLYPEARTLGYHQLLQIL